MTTADIIYNREKDVLQRDMYQMRTSEKKNKQTNLKIIFLYNFLRKILQERSTNIQMKRCKSIFYRLVKWNKKKLLFALRDQEKQGKEMI